MNKLFVSQRRQSLMGSLVELVLPTTELSDECLRLL